MKMKQMGMLLVRSSGVRDKFDLSTADNIATPSIPMLLSVLSENEMKYEDYH
jgi:hypothetical protein